MLLYTIEYIQTAFTHVFSLTVKESEMAQTILYVEVRYQATIGNNVPVTTESMGTYLLTVNRHDLD